MRNPCTTIGFLTLSSAFFSLRCLSWAVPGSGTVPSWISSVVRWLGWLVVFYKIVVVRSLILCSSFHPDGNFVSYSTQPYCQGSIDELHRDYPSQEGNACSGVLANTILNIIMNNPKLLHDFIISLCWFTLLSCFEITIIHSIDILAQTKWQHDAARPYHRKLNYLSNICLPPGSRVRVSSKVLFLWQIWRPLTPSPQLVSLLAEVLATIVVTTPTPYAPIKSKSVGQERKSMTIVILYNTT